MAVQAQTVTGDPRNIFYKSAGSQAKISTQGALGEEEDIDEEEVFVRCLFV